jgi:hypothetical protein
MKRIFTLLALVGLTGTAWAQCTPDASNTSDLIYPAPQDLNTDLEVGVAYDETITLNVPADTTIFISVDIDSVTISNVSGLPSGINYQCQNSTCSTPGGQQGCVSIFGTPDQAGTYTVNLEITVHTALTTLPQTETITVVVSEPNSVANLTAEQVGLTVYPNPVKESANVRFNMSSESEVSVRVFNVLGGVVYQSQEIGSVGVNSIVLPSQSWNAGYYLLNIEIDGKQFNQKFSIIR